MQECLERAARIADTNLSVFLIGETGVGKGILAEAIHKDSPRRDQPFVKVVCSAIPSELIESTLFGHKKGAFTGAYADAIGKFRSANGGTLFLDEIGELSPSAQVKLLDAVETRSIQPVGDSRTYPIDIRIIAATNKNFDALNMREDLFFRLCQYSISIPPLRDRKEDLQRLSAIFLRQFDGDRCFNDEITAWFQTYDWPGNVRQLINVIQSAAVDCDGLVIRMQDIRAPQLGTKPKAVERAQETSGESQGFRINLLDQEGRFRHLGDMERQIKEAAIAFYDGNIPRAAAALGINPSTLYRRARGMRAAPE